MNVGTFSRKNALQLGAGLAAVLLLKFVVFADKQPAVVTAAEKTVLVRLRNPLPMPRRASTLAAHRSLRPLRQIPRLKRWHLR